MSYRMQIHPSKSNSCLLALVSSWCASPISRGAHRKVPSVRQIRPRLHFLGVWLLTPNLFWHSRQLLSRLQLSCFVRSSFLMTLPSLLDFKQIAKKFILKFMLFFSFSFSRVILKSILISTWELFKSFSSEQTKEWP